jgi:hypothetical protein
MNKCSFCVHSYNDKGIIKCPFSACKLTASDIAKILLAIGDRIS